ncbi:MAG: SurA N-terminal domain-containing protein [Acidobacteriota bacterium]
MLKVFRDNLKYLSWILWLVIAVFILFVFVDFGSAGRGLAGNNTAAAVVNGEEIGFDEFRSQYRNLEQRFRQIYGDQYSSELAEQLRLPQQALQQVVDRRLLLREADKLGIRVSNQEVRDAVLDIPWLQDDQGNFVGSEEYLSILDRSRISPEAFEDDLRQQITLERLNRVLAESLYIPDEAVEKSYREQTERASIRYLMLPENTLKEEGRATREELKAYLEANPEDFRFGERRRVSFLLVDNGRMRNEVTVEDDAVRAYYDANPDEFTQEEQVQARHILLRTSDERDLDQAKVELEAIRARIEGGEGFAQVASDTSDDPGSAGRGGHLGFFGRGRMTPEFEKAAFESPQGELIGPIETPFGVHLLEVTGRLDAGLQEFDKVQARIRSKLLSEQVVSASEQKATELTAQLGEAGSVNLDALTALAEDEAAVSINSPEPFGQEDLIPGLGRAPEFMTAVFELATGAIGDPIKVPRGWALPLVREVLEPRAPELVEVETKVRAAAEKEKRQQLAMDRIAAAKADIEGGDKTLDAVAEDLGLTVEESDSFGTGGVVEGLGFSPRIAEAAMGLDVGAVDGPYGTNQGAVLFEVTDRVVYDAAAFEEARSGTRARLENQELGQLLSSLLQQRRLESDISYSRQLQEDLGLVEVSG